MKNEHRGATTKKFKEATSNFVSNSKIMKKKKLAWQGVCRTKKVFQINLIQKNIFSWYVIVAASVSFYEIQGILKCHALKSIG